MTAQLELVPGDSLGSFQLGSTLFNVLDHLRSYRSTYPSVKVAWDEVAPSSSPILLSLASPPLSLLFDPPTQRLLRIELNADKAGEWVSYRGKSLRESEGEDVVRTVRRVMGPTYGASGVQLGVGEEEMLSYPGVAFGVVLGSEGKRLARIVVTPLPLAEGVPVEQAWLSPTLAVSPPISQGDLRLVEIKLNPSRAPSSVSLHFHSPNASSPPPPVVLQIGQTTSEDLLCQLGSPVRSFWKEDDRLSIHSTSLSDPFLSPNPYFLSHPHLGLTFLLHPTSHTLLKMILHSNLPGEVHFGRSTRCAWDLVADGERVGGEEGFAAVELLLGGGGTELEALGRKEGGSDAGSVDSNRSDSPAGSKARKGAGAKVQATVGSEVERPMILDRTVDGGDSVVVGKTTALWIPWDRARGHGDWGSGDRVDVLRLHDLLDSV